MAYIGKVVAGGATHLVGSTLYGTCSTAAGTVAKVVVSTDFTELVTGVTIHIKFAETNTATSPTLTIQNAASNPTYTTGAKAIMKYGTTAAGTTAATSWYAGTVVALTYDGTNWIMNDHIDDTDTKVTQTATTANAEYEVLFSATADNTTRTESARKSNKLKFNPSTGTLTATKMTTPAITLNGSDLATILGGKQASLTTTQLAAVNSGITAEKLTQDENNISLLRVHGGLKNYATINNGTYTANSGGGTHSITIPFLGPITGDIVISIGNITSNDVDSSTCAFVFENDITSRETVAVSRGDNINVSVSMGTFVATKLEIYPAASYQLSNGDTVSWTDLMICTKEDWDNSHDYQPYARSNLELTNNISSLYKVGTVNILKNTAQTQTVGGVTFTMNTDGTITANGTKTNNDWLYLSTGNSLKKSTYVLSSGGIIGDDKLVIVTTGDTLGTAIMTTNTATGVYERKLTQDYSNLYYAIRIASGTVCNNLTFKPMLCEKNVYEAINSEFQPYAMSNTELTAKELQNKMSFGFSGNPNPAVYVKDWNFVPDGTYLLSYICSQDASTRRGVSVYMFSKYTTNHIVLFTPVVEASGAVISSCVASGSDGAKTITFTMGQRGYHTAAAIQIQAF